MEGLIIRERQKIEVQIKSIQASINRAEKSIGILRQDLSTFPHVEKLKQSIKANELLIADLEARIEALNQGKLTDELANQQQENTCQAKRSLETKQSKRLKLDNDKQKKFNEMREFEGGIRREDRTERWLNKEINKAYRYYTKICTEFPTNMARNIKNMANNKGYIWRGVYFYGNKPIESADTVMFERKGAKQHIHTWTDTEYRLTEKQEGRKRPIILKKEIRKKRGCTTA